MDFKLSRLFIGMIVFLITGHLLGSDIDTVPSDVLFRINTIGEEPIDIIKNKNDEYLLLTNINDNGILRKISKNGNVIWKVTLNPGKIEFNTKRVEQIGSNYYVAGGESYDATGTILFKISESGSKLWMKKYTIDSPRDPWVSEYPQCEWIVGNESNVYLVGSTRFTGRQFGSNSIYYSKIDIDGVKIWEKQTKFGWPVDVCLAPDGDLVIVGMESRAAIIIKVNKDSGESKWKRVNFYGERYRAVDNTSNGGFIAVATSGEPTLRFVKYDRYGFSEYEGSYSHAALGKIALVSDVLEVHDHYYIPFTTYYEKENFMLVADSTLINIEVYKTPANFIKLLNSDNSILALGYEKNETVLYRIKL